jgi:hypothetical protein
MNKTQFQPTGPELEANDDEAEVKPTRIDRCETCKYADASDDGFLLCRRRPPSSHAIVGAGPNGPRVLGTVTSLPRVSPHEWCGEWLPKNAIAS